MNAEQEPEKFLNWIADRLVNVYGEHENVDFVLALRRLAEHYDTPLLEAWNGERKVTIYPKVVIRVWGANIMDEMSDEPRTHESVGRALRWLYETPDPNPRANS